MTHLLKISKSGYNVLTETNPNNLVFSSAYNTLKYYHSGSTACSITSGASPQNQEFDIYTHNLGYYPFFTACMKFDADTSYYNLPMNFGDGGYWGLNLIYTTTTKLIHRSERGNIWGERTGSYTATIYFKIFKNNLGV